MLIHKPWQSRMGKDAACLAASCDPSIRLLKVLQEINCLTTKNTSTSFVYRCAYYSHLRIQNPYLAHGSQPLRPTTAFRLTGYRFPFP